MQLWLLCYQFLSVVATAFNLKGRDLAYPPLLPSIIKRTGSESFATYIANHPFQQQSMRNPTMFESLRDRGLKSRSSSFSFSRAFNSNSRTDSLHPTHTKHLLNASPALHERSDLFRGTLINGLRYLILPTNISSDNRRTGVGEAEIQLEIQSGSINELEHQQGSIQYYTIYVYKFAVC